MFRARSPCKATSFALDSSQHLEELPQFISHASFQDWGEPGVREEGGCRGISNLGPGLARLPLIPVSMS